MLKISYKNLSIKYDIFSKQNKLFNYHKKEWVQKRKCYETRDQKRTNIKISLMVNGTRQKENGDIRERFLLSSGVKIYVKIKLNK